MARLLWILLLVFFPVCAYGHGFANYVQGAKAFAMGGAFTAVADDPSAVFYNPAGIQQLSDTQIMAGFINFFPPDGNFTSMGTSNIPESGEGQKTTLDSSNHLIPYFYATHKSKEKLSFGLGIYTPFGQSTQWPDDWEGRFTPGGDESEIKSYRIEPVIAFSPISRLSLSFGIFYQHVDITIQQKNWLPGEFESKIKGNDSGIGGSVGLLFDVTNNLSFGLSYKSGLEHNFNDMTVDIEPEVPIFGIIDTKANMDFSTPAMIFAGFLYSFEKWKFSLDTYWTDWSVQDTLIASTDSSIFGDIIVNKNWDDTFIFGLGIQYSLSPSINLYGGYIYDQSPVPSKTLDAIVIHGDSQVFCFGFEYQHESFTLNIAYGYITAEDQFFNNSVGDSPNPGGRRVTGTFEDNSLNIITTSIIFQF